MQSISPRHWSCIKCVSAKTPHPHPGPARASFFFWISTSILPCDYRCSTRGPNADYLLTALLALSVPRWTVTASSFPRSSPTAGCPQWWTGHRYIRLRKASVATVSSSPYSRRNSPCCDDIGRHASGELNMICIGRGMAWQGSRKSS